MPRLLSGRAQNDPFCEAHTHAPHGVCLSVSMTMSDATSVRHRVPVLSVPLCTLFRPATSIMARHAQDRPPSQSHPQTLSVLGALLIRRAVGVRQSSTSCT